MKVLYAVITSRVLHTASINFGARVIQLIIIFGERYNICTSSLRNRLHLSPASFLLSSTVILNTPLAVLFILTGFDGNFHTYEETQYSISF